MLHKDGLGRPGAPPSPGSSAPTTSGNSFETAASNSEAMTTQNAPKTERQQAEASVTEFIAAARKNGSARQFRHLENDKINQTCWFNCYMLSDCEFRRNQDVQKAPACSVKCYIRVKKPITTETSDPRTVHPEASTSTAAETKYRLPILQNHYYYKGSGQVCVKRHMEPWTPESVHKLDLFQQDKAAKAAATAVENGTSFGTRGAIGNTVPAATATSIETLYPFEATLANTLQRFENHLYRIYSPTWNTLMKAPQILEDGKPQWIAQELYTRAVNGEGLVLGQKLLEQGGRLIRSIVPRASSVNADGRDGSGRPPDGTPPPPMR